MGIIERTGKLVSNFFNGPTGESVADALIRAESPTSVWSVILDKGGRILAYQYACGRRTKKNAFGQDVEINCKFVSDEIFAGIKKVNCLGKENDSGMRPKKGCGEVHLVFDVYAKCPLCGAESDLLEWMQTKTHTVRTVSEKGVIDHIEKLAYTNVEGFPDFSKLEKRYRVSGSQGPKYIKTGPDMSSDTAGDFEYEPADLRTGVAWVKH
jgi:hypothetical protein